MTYRMLNASEIKIGSCWAAADGSNSMVVVEGINTYGTFDPWFEVVYSWEEDGVKKTHEKDIFAFQTRYYPVTQ